MLDPFCGSGTTLVAANLLDRNSIGIDISPEAIKVTKDRLKSPIKTEFNLLQMGVEAYRDKSEEIVQFLFGMDFVIVQRNKGIDAFLNIDLDGVPIPVKVQRPEESLLESALLLYKTSRKKNAKIMILVRTHKENDLGFSNEFPPEIVVVDLTKFQLKK